ncbi:aspartate aminotransferase/hypothetical protein [Allopseudospirillum japonicum]|uniref:Aminotransferase n=1 Tax=Allopseudospirillum japonicum TaxID=64971 RepID=A0A1H6RP47_9GAMM|nr:pyridoxal phosphate-dependent aminotransferase [Allopseudospirillum japonicum]SEI55134.1 aspartate aminotransferase/hypothetical protein [Allopseudospirillum japonicum]
MLTAADLRPISHSETLLINERSGALASTRTLYRFGFGESPFPVPLLLQEALNAARAEKSYLPVQGLPALRAQVAEFHRQQDQVTWDAQGVVIGPGSKLLIYAVLASFVRAQVLLVSPSWVSYQPQAELAGLSVARIYTQAHEQWRLTPEALEAFCQHRENPHLPLILVLNYPNNPTGDTYTGEQLAELAQVLRRHQIIVISDEIYGVLHHQGAHQSLARFYPEGTLVTGGLSKWGALGGWRLGVLHIPKPLRAHLLPRILGVASETWSSVAAPVQYAAIQAYAYPQAIADFVAQERRVLARIGQQSAAILAQVAVETPQPTGGFYLFPNFEAWRTQLAHVGVFTSADLCAYLLEQAGVVLLPASAFGMPASVLAARLAYVNFDGQAALEAASDQQIDVVAAPVYAGMQAIVETLNKLLTPRVVGA